MKEDEIKVRTYVRRREIDAYVDGEERLRVRSRECSK